MGNLSFGRRVGVITADQTKTMSHPAQIDETEIEGKNHCRDDEPNNNQWDGATRDCDRGKNQVGQIDQ